VKDVIVRTSRQCMLVCVLLGGCTLVTTDSVQLDNTPAALSVRARILEAGVPSESVGWVSCETNGNGVALEMRAVRSEYLEAIRPVKVHHLTIARSPNLENLDSLRDYDLRTLTVGSSGVSDIRALRGMNLESLILTELPLSDLSPLKGMTTLRRLHLGRTQITTVTDLRNLELRELDIPWTSVADLSPLGEVPLSKLNIEGTSVADLAPTRAMPLTELNVWQSEVRALDALEGQSLLSVTFSPERITSGLHVLRGMVSLRSINGVSPAKFWASIRGRRPADRSGSP